MVRLSRAAQKRAKKRRVSQRALPKTLLEEIRKPKRLKAVVDVRANETKCMFDYEQKLVENQHLFYMQPIQMPQRQNPCGNYDFCNDGKCMYEHGERRADLLCTHQVPAMRKSKKNPSEFDRDSVLKIGVTCSDKYCPLKHCCYVCSYAPNCGCVMPHEQQYYTSKGVLLGSLLDQAGHVRRVGQQCQYRFSVAIDMIVDAAHGEGPFCPNTTEALQKYSDVLHLNRKWRQANETLAIMWQVAGRAFDECEACCKILDSISCENSGEMCPNDGVSIYNFVKTFQISKSAPMLGNPSPMNNVFSDLFDSDDEEPEQPGFAELDQRHADNNLCGLCPRNFTASCFGGCNLEHFIKPHEFTESGMATVQRHAAVFDPSLSKLVEAIFRDLQIIN